MGRKKLDRACLCVKARLRRGEKEGERTVAISGSGGGLGWLDRGMGEVALGVIYSILHAKNLFAKGLTKVHLTPLK